MKGIFSFTHLPFGHLWGRFVIGLLLIGSFAQAQEAFYIYRNDGDFNGFFYDEVQEMRYSKIGVDSVENDRWVTYEVVLADTTYRIPLSSIDSIGFQQPEIKFNPRAHFLVRDGYEPYLSAVKINGCTFMDLPANLPIEVGDVLIGLPTDPRAETLYINTPGNLGSGSFSCVVDKVETWTYNGSIITGITGHPVTQIGDVFEQYITVEQVTIDDQNQIRRRIAGCDENGMPRKVTKVEGEGELELFDFSFNLTREWQPSGLGKVDLSAEINLKDKMRVAYNVTLLKFYAKLTNELTAKVKPSLGIQLNASYEATSDDWAALPHIYFPAACPIFETNPMPMFFFRVDGTVEARLNMPQVSMGLGTDFILNSASLFPVSYGMHLVPDESAELTDDMLDLSASVTFKGMVQTGIKFQMNIATANWFKKVLMTDLGLHLYIGPKLSAQLQFKMENLINIGDNVYPTKSTTETFQKAYISLALLSVDVEAKAKASAFWGDPVEKKFMDKSWGFMTDSVFMAPRFDSMTVHYDSTQFQMKIRLYPKKSKIIGCSHVQLGMRRNLSTNEYEFIEPVYFMGLAESDTLMEYTFDDVRPDGKSYHFFPVVLFSNIAKLRAAPEMYYSVPIWNDMSSDTITFGAKTDLTKVITIHTNALANGFTINKLSAFDQWLDVDQTKLEVVSDPSGDYQVKFVALPNNTIFAKETSVTDPSRPYISIHIPGSDDFKHVYYIGMSQPAPALTNVTLNLSSSFKVGNQTRTYGYNGAVTVTPVGENKYHVEGSYEDTSVSKITKSYSVSFDFELTPNYTGNQRKTLASGTFTYHMVSQLSDKREVQYSISFGTSVDGNTSGAKGALDSGTYKEFLNDVPTVDENIENMETKTSVNFTLTAN